MTKRTGPFHTLSVCLIILACLMVLYANFGPFIIATIKDRL